MTPWTDAMIICTLLICVTVAGCFAMYTYGRKDED